ncbi:MAG: hypothetical protein JNN07_03760 [Verrucomicrobiales bacterium]|nr:hypothetical protein [Verrucomicrobiales bacterium]
MNTRRKIKCASIAAASGVTIFLGLSLPRTRSLPESYTYAYFPRGGYRYLIAPGGIKKVGQEVLDYHVAGTIVTGTVRLRLEDDDVRIFRLDLKSHEVTFGERGQAHPH